MSEIGLTVLFVDNNDSFTYNLIQMLEELGAEIKLVNGKNEEIEHLNAYSYIMFSPGPGLPDDFPLMSYILENYKPHQKILGVCLGLQAIAKFFNGRLINKAIVQHGVQQEIFMHPILQNSCLRHIPERFHAGLYHSWAVDEESLPHDLIITCSTEDGVIMGLIHKSDRIEGLQFHPESIMTPGGYTILKTWLEK
ncbi:MAG: aminodeoxychorismate/anthranilate synthase component II [Bacteroidota bacterium]|nr:aminodeoxychorismate/anthranilate synthase component II [Bacteroidota bacterium]